MTINEFFTRYLNKPIDFDHAYGNTCVDLYRQYCQEVLNIPQSPPVSGAADIWTTYPKDKFSQVVNTIWAIPKPGDIIIWSKQLNGYGHVAICASANLWSFSSFDQNWPIGSPCHYQMHNYRYVLGWLRPIPNHLDLQIAFINSKQPIEESFKTSLSLYSQNKISCQITHYNEDVLSSPDQFTSYALVDHLDIKEKYIFIFYPGTSSDTFYKTFYYPQRNCTITTCPRYDFPQLTYELALQLQKRYNSNRGSNPYIEVTDDYYPNSQSITTKLESIAPYYNILK